ncbi:peptidylprolyl isomerase fpr4 [Geranomyces variabilis]|nr:peptidylprolyl isomerase fpr4 [Geranomyces variabilis]
MVFLKAGIWGLKVQSGKEYSTQVQDSFVITMAALTAALPKNGARTSISIKKDDREFVICSLTPGKIEQQVLDLTFLEGEEITFKTTGPCDIDLTGNNLVFAGDDGEDDEDYDSEDSEEGRFMEFGSGDEDDDEDDEEESSADEEELQAQMQAAIAAMNGKRKAGAVLPASAKKAKITEVVEEEMKQEAPATPAQTKKQAAAAKKAEAAAAAASAKKDVKKEPATPAAAAKKAETPLSAKAVAKTAAATNQTAASPAASTPAKSTPAITPKSTKKTLANGLIIEDVTEGNGPKAKNGKKVGVRYIGRLTNGKVFDSNTKGAPFKFKLGAGDVIKGWDLGVAGMSVGGTRKLTIPAALAYGPKGAPPDIPGHATLEFEVKLMEVK